MVVFKGQAKMLKTAVDVVVTLRNNIMTYPLMYISLLPADHDFFGFGRFY